MKKQSGKFNSRFYLLIDFLNFHSLRLNGALSWIKWIDKRELPLNLIQRKRKYRFKIIEYNLNHTAWEKKESRHYKYKPIEFVIPKLNNFLVAILSLSTIIII